MSRISSRGLILSAGVLLLFIQLVTGGESRSLRFQASSPADARKWQRAVRDELFARMMGGQMPSRVPLEPKTLRRMELPGGVVLEEISLQTLPDRRAHAWLARSAHPTGKVGAVLALHGHGGSGEQVVRGRGLYWYGGELIERGYVVIAPDIGQHELQHTNWSLMGERTWDALRCLDYLATLPEVDTNRLAVAGLSLGGETTMYVAALDERIGVACSSGWLTTVANMKNGHCPCYDFPGLEHTFDFADIFACVAPRTMVCELGEQEAAPGGFPVTIGQQAFRELRSAYQVLDAPTNAVLTVHSGPHVFNGRDFWPRLEVALGQPRSPVPATAQTVAWLRFADAPESLDGTPYYWLARYPLRLRFECSPHRGDAIELSWGGKGDERQAFLLVNGRTLPVQGGGHWGFRWLRVPIPEGLAGDHYDIELKPGPGQAGFVSEIRLTRDSGDGPGFDPKVTARNASIVTTASAEDAVTDEAFPQLRPSWDQESEPPKALMKDARRVELFRKAEKNGRLANESLFRCRRYIDGWLAHADPATGLIPRNLRESDYWNGRDSAADNYPFMVLTAAITDRPLLEGRLLDMLHTEERLTCRLGRLPDDYSFSKRGWRRDQFNLDEVIFDGAEYVKDGLLYIAEWMGKNAWSERMTGITEDIWKYAPIETAYGRLPTHNFEVCGDLLQSCSRLYWFTGQRQYLDWAIRLGDFYLLGTNHPTRDLNQLRLLDHGCEVINGLTELYVAVAYAQPDKKRAYQAPMHEMFDGILSKGRNSDGLLYSWFNPKTGEHSAGLCDTWGYVYDGVYTMWLLDHTEAYRDAVRQALGNLKGKYVGACWDDKSADGFADSIEGALNLYNREPIDSAGDWIDSQTRLMWSIQKPDGIIEAWHGDGNFARTSLMYALWKTLGLTVQPWRQDLQFGAASDQGILLITLKAGQPWEGRLVFDRRRHSVLMHLPFDYARINQFPEWFAVQLEQRYQIKVNDSRARTFKGAEMAEGIPLKLKPGERVLVEVN